MGMVFALRKPQNGDSILEKHRLPPERAMQLLSNNIYSSVSSYYARVGPDQERVRTSGRECPKKGKK